MNRVMKDAMSQSALPISFQFQRNVKISDPVQYATQPVKYIIVQIVKWDNSKKENKLITSH